MTTQATADEGGRVWLWEVSTGMGTGPGGDEALVVKPEPEGANGAASPSRCAPPSLLMEMSTLK